MSRAYRVTWTTAASSVTLDDCLHMKLSLLGILAEAEMTELLRQELEGRGWERSADGGMKGTVKGCDATLTPDGTSMRVTASATRDVRARGPSEEDARAALAEAEGKARDAMKTTLLRHLKEAESDLRGMMGEVIQRVYVEALKRRAASMGTIEGIQETRRGEGDYELTIKVKT